MNDDSDLEDWSSDSEIDSENIISGFHVYINVSDHSFIFHRMYNITDVGIFFLLKQTGLSPKYYKDFIEIENPLLKRKIPICAEKNMDDLFLLNVLMLNIKDFKE